MSGKKVLLTALMLAYLAGSPNHKNTSLSNLFADEMPPNDRPVAELSVDNADSGSDHDARIEGADGDDDISLEPTMSVGDMDTFLYNYYHRSSVLRGSDFNDHVGDILKLVYPQLLGPYEAEHSMNPYLRTDD